MSKRRLVVDVENEMIDLSMATSLEEKRPGEFIDKNYSDARNKVEKARVPLAELGMYEAVKSVIEAADHLRKQRQFEAAYQVLYKTYRELMKKSGTDDKNARRYGKKGPVAQGAAMVVTADGVEEWGVLGPDGYGGEFLKAVSTAERDLVFAVDAGFFGLRGKLVVSEMHAASKGGDAGEGFPAVFKGLRSTIINARPLLEKLGVYLMLLGALTQAESLTEEGEFAEAEQLLGVAEKVLGDRCGTTALRAKHFSRGLQS